jgi:hypothetical protein
MLAISKINLTSSPLLKSLIRTEYSFGFGSLPLNPSTPILDLLVCLRIIAPTSNSKITLKSFWSIFVVFLSKNSLV